jgi:uncharacterized protein YjiS (DUF1127 family)
MITTIPNPLGVLANLEHSFTMWLHRAYSRNELRNLGDRDLRNVGLSRASARSEAASRSG